ncbi:hypothetical protein HY086_00460 [Candidatus Gottesmanbacteria bacterium]|nr:hypothetical protein [Candidatus Gottesmanbacteria bacterium]
MSGIAGDDQFVDRFLDNTCGVFTKKFKLFFKGSSSTSSGQARKRPIHSPRHLYRSDFSLAYFLRARFSINKAAKI